MFVLMFEKGEEVVTGLENFAKKNKVVGGQITAIGGLSDVVMTWFDWKRKKYKKAAEIRQQVQVLSLTGDIAYEKGHPRVHCQIVVGKPDGSTYGGHLVAAHVRPLLEVILFETSQYFLRRFDPESGLALIRPEPQSVKG